MQTCMMRPMTGLKMVSYDESSMPSLSGKLTWLLLGLGLGLGSVVQGQGLGQGWGWGWGWGWG